MRISAFTPWARWFNRRVLPELQYPGVYVVARAARSLDGRRFSWRNEIVYVGMTNAKGGLRARLQQLDDTMAGKRVSHGGADRIRFRYRHYERFAGGFVVAVCAVPCDVTTSRPRDLLKMGDVAKLEYECLAAYVRRIGRLPEFNDKAKARKYSLTVGKERG
jgi:hypothetical protein